jgi:hypothetical protein
MKWKVRNLDDERAILETDDGKWHETPSEAIKDKIELLEADLPQWINEARAALEIGDLWRGGGVLRLGELMMQLTSLQSELRAIERNQAIRKRLT